MLPFWYDANFGARSHAHLHLVTRCKTIGIDALLVLWFAVGQGLPGIIACFLIAGIEPHAGRLYFAIVGAAAFQNSIIVWASDHRRHHQNVDTHQDPYNAKRGFLYSHIGWIIYGPPSDGRYDNVPDLKSDWVCRIQHRYYWPIGIAFNLLFHWGWAFGQGASAVCLFLPCLSELSVCIIAPFSLIHWPTFGEDNHGRRKTRLATIGC